MKSWVAILSLGLAVSGQSADLTATNETETTGPGGGPVIRHVPVLRVARGSPLSVTAKVFCEKAAVTSVSLVTKASWVGKPVATAMAGGQDAAYQGESAMTLVPGVDRVWYYLDAKTDDGRTAETRWLPVEIIDPASHGGPGKPALIIGGLVGLAAGMWALADNGGDDNDGAPASRSTPAPAPSSSSGGGAPAPAKSDSKDESPEEPPPPGCTTGSESVFLMNTPPCVDGPIGVHVCGTCSGAVLRAEGDWGAVDSRSGYSGEGCASTGPAALTLAKPAAVAGAGTHTIRIYSNGVLIRQETWPSESDLAYCREF